MKREQELEVINYLIDDLEDIIENATHEDDVAYRKGILALAKQKKRELKSNMQIIQIPMRNGHNIVVDINSWSDEFPDEICVYFKDNDVILQDIAIIREHKTNDSVEVLVYADHYNEDYTHKFEIEEHDFDKEDN